MCRRGPRPAAPCADQTWPEVHQDVRSRNPRLSAQPANLYGLKLTDSFVKTVELVVNNSYDTKAMELLYKTFGEAASGSAAASAARRRPAFARNTSPRLQPTRAAGTYAGRRLRPPGSHFVSTVVLGGFVSTSMGSSAASISQQTSSGVSVSAAISYGMASVSSSTESKSFKGATAQDLGWSWSAIMVSRRRAVPGLREALTRPQGCDVSRRAETFSSVQ